jgi:hypothetical protein
MAALSPRLSLPSIPLFTGVQEYSFYEVAPIASGSLMMLASGSVYLVSAYSSELQTELSMVCLHFIIIYFFKVQHIFFLFLFKSL